MFLNEFITDRRFLNALAKKNILTVNDVLRVLPLHYLDYRRVRRITECAPGKHYAVAGILKSVTLKTGTRKYLSLKFETPDAGKDGIFYVILFSRTFLLGKLSGMTGTEMVVTGAVTYDGRFGYGIAEPDGIVPERDFIPGIRTVYPKMKGISDARFRGLSDECLERIHEPLEWEVMEKTGVTDYRTALGFLHHPESAEDINAGRARLRFNDLLYFAMGLCGSGKNEPEPAPLMDDFSDSDTYAASLPYSLTPDQISVWREIKDTVSSGRMLNMLLQGDVGSGKTVIAIFLMLAARKKGVQTVMMAPRGVLAAQHYATVTESGAFPEGEVVFLASEMKVSERKKVLKKIKDGSAKCIIGTHSCISETVEYANLGVIITDEEHLFGVRQKEALADRIASGVHLLSMSATPIPRTVADILYGGQKTVSAIRTMPEGRIPVQTAVIRSRTTAMPFMLKEIEAGHRCYVVCPAIEGNDDMGLTGLETVRDEYVKYFTQYGKTAGMVHGRMKAGEVEEIIGKFRDGIIDILLSTTVIEVGVNIPDATVMVIEQADRFGLAALHQLRGRVGRSSYKSYCILLSEAEDNARLNVLVSTNDGFAIAEADMEQRGPGELFGLRQSGANRYVEMMLEDPEYFGKIRKIAEYCRKNGFGQNLTDLYDCSDPG